DAEARLGELLRETIGWEIVRTAHDVSEGGLAVALAEATFGAGVGARVKVPLVPRDLFSESQGRAVVAIVPAQIDRFLEAAARHGVPALEVGETGGDRLVIEADGATLDVEVARLRTVWSNALPAALGL
ncbi:MAG TPA: AIR synthase-related protein, partial [Thermoanaerobaculia bacterium]|nr:AIR synthase-related protein [Thermoanaerobaculia bacterium]